MFLLAAFMRGFVSVHVPTLAVVPFIALQIVLLEAIRQKIIRQSKKNIPNAFVWAGYSMRVCLAVRVNSPY